MLTREKIRFWEIWEGKGGWEGLGDQVGDEKIWMNGEWGHNEGIKGLEGGPRNF